MARKKTTTQTTPVTRGMRPPPVMLAREFARAPRRFGGKG
ncbi:hypothetical protein D187_005557 [Cystobacter fuscus DSM 2262]|uniref:Uncharacterized protein n=1 Tax=Cystobacter fuscus (strain ATCC 25194 / DSM 2262 / NBRC 100088 / M29) TaxID=1242864 RepID=S9R609_CYSF2|nr:hypothetical protein D187_005557 [Cystobacter fuscus DSM 2262]